MPITPVPDGGIMRRKDREITDIAAITDVIEKSHCCRIGFYDNGEVYIVPLNYGFEKGEDDTFTFYFHSAKEGRKIDLIASAPQVGFEIDCDYELHPGEIACAYSAGFHSVIGNGVVEPVTEPEEKKHGLCCIMRHLTGRADWSFEEKTYERVAVFKLTTTKYSCKRHE